MQLVDDDDRVRQLTALKKAILAFLPVVSDVETLRNSASAYLGCLTQVERLLSDGFSQEDLSTLSRAIPRLFWLHKEWTPQLERAADGRYQEPSWFAAADKLHQQVQDAAAELRIIGRY